MASGVGGELTLAESHREEKGTRKWDSKCQRESVLGNYAHESQTKARRKRMIKTRLWNFNPQTSSMGVRGELVGNANSQAQSLLSVEPRNLFSQALQGFWYMITFKNHW